MEFLSEFGLFLAKAITLLAVVLIIISAVFTSLRAAKSRDRAVDQLQVDHLNRAYEQAALKIQCATLPPKTAKAARKAAKARRKEAAKQVRQRLFVLDFQGDLRASAVQSLRDEVTAVLTSARDDDEVLVRLESPGGIVHGYGLAASQLLRIRERGIHLTVAVDKVAASGGYMMACVADRILAAPFAIIGSIGVIAQLPNFNRLLKKHDIDYEQFMAGEYKRTITLFGENTPEGRQKFQGEIEDVHQLFKDFIARYRPQLDMDTVATGEYWYGTRALDHALIDELKTSDDFLLEKSHQVDLYRVSSSKAKPWLARLMNQAGEAASRALDRSI